MKYINSWKSSAKQSDKIDITIRLGSITFVKIYFDNSSNKFILTLLNFTLKN